MLIKRIVFSMSLIRHLRTLHVSFCPRGSVSRLKPFRKSENKELTLNTSTDARKRKGNLTQSEIDFLTHTYGRPNDWNPIYRLKAMPFAQAFSKLKLILTFTLVIGTPVSVFLQLSEEVDKSLCWFLFSASIFSLCTLCLFSFYSTKVIGIISQHKSTGLLRLGLLTFWGNRHNILIYPEQLLPAADLSSSTMERTVRVGLVGDVSTPTYETIKPLYISFLTGQICNRKLFEKYVGKMWQDS